MRLLGRAAELEAAGRSIVHLEVGEPDFPTPEPVVAAGRRALAEGRTRYTPARGLAALREDLAGYYAGRYGVEVDPARVLITPGASGALQLVFQAVLEPGDRVLLCDPSYPCYRQVLGLLGAEPVAVPVGPETDYQLTTELAAAAWVPGVRAVVAASPSNPTGSSLTPAAMAGLYDLCRARGAAFIVDEIYQGLTYEAPDRTALALDSMTWASRLLEEAGVALTPGHDFGTYAPERHVRFAYTRETADLDEGVRRIGAALA